MLAIISSVTVEPLMFLSMQTFFLHVVTFPQMVLENVCLMKHNQTKCQAMYTGSSKDEYNKVQGEATLWFGTIAMAMSFVTVICLPFVAQLSDEFGRRKIMSLTPLSQLAQSAIIVCILSTGLNFSTWLMVLVALIPAFVGEISGLFLFTSSYIADITTEKTRTLRLNLLESASILSGFVAAMSSGHILDRFGYKGIYIANTGLAIIAILYLVVFVKPIDRSMLELTEKADPYAHMREGQDEKNDPKTAPKDFDNNKQRNEAQEVNERKALIEKSDVNENIIDVNKSSTNETNIATIEENGKDSALLVNEPSDRNSEEEQNETRKSVSSRLCVLLRKSNPLSNFRRFYKVLKSHGQLRYGLVLFLVLVLTTVTYSAEMVVTVLFLRNGPFYMDPVQIGYFLAFKSAGISVIGLVIVNLLFTRVLKLNDNTILLLTLSAYTIYYVLLGLASSTLMLYLIQILLAVSTLTVPTIRAMISKLTTPSTVSLLFSVSLIVETFSVLIGSMVGPLVYFSVVSSHPGSVFFIIGGFMIVSTFLALGMILAKYLKREESSEVEVPNDET